MRKPLESDESDRVEPSARDPARVSTRTFDPVLAAVVTSAAILRFATLGRQSLWYDEWATTNDITGGITGLWSRLKRDESTPPLFFALETVWKHLFGGSDVALRSLSAFAGTGTVVVMYFVARELCQSRRVARIAALLTAVHPFLIWYSQEARAYALLTFFASLCMLGFARALRRGSRWDYASFGLAGAAALWTHYFAIFLVAPLLVVLTISRWRQYARVVLAAFFVAWSISSLYPLAAHQVDTGNLRWIRPWSLHFRLDQGAQHTLVGIGVSNVWLWRFAAVLLLVALGELVLRGSAEQRRVGLMMCFVGAFAVVVPIVVESRYVVDRNLIAALLPFIVVVAIGLGASNLGRLAAVPVACLVSVQLVALAGLMAAPKEQRTDWRAVAAAARLSTGDHVVVINSTATFASALRRYLPEARVLGSDQYVPAVELDYVHRSDDPRHCDMFYGQACLIWPVDSGPPDILSPSYPSSETVRTPDLRVDRYRARHPFPVQARQLVIVGATDAVVLFIPAKPTTGPK